MLVARQGMAQGVIHGRDELMACWMNGWSKRPSCHKILFVRGGFPATRQLPCGRRSIPADVDVGIAGAYLNAMIDTWVVDQGIWGGEGFNEDGQGVEWSTRARGTCA